MIVDMILLDEKVILSTYDCYIRILRPVLIFGMFFSCTQLLSKRRSMPAASILSGVVSVKVLCIRLVDLSSHGATIISHSPFVSTIERPSQKRQTRRRIFPLSFFDSAATSSYEHWLIRTDNYHMYISSLPHKTIAIRFSQLC